MEQPRKGKQWQVGMKLHLGGDAQTGLVHSLAPTAATIHDLPPELLLPGEEVGSGVTRVLGN